MPRVAKSKYDKWSATDKQAFQTAGGEVYDDTHAATPSGMTTHEDAYGDHSTTLDSGPARDPRYKNRAAEIKATKGQDLAKESHPSTNLVWQREAATPKQELGAKDIGMTPERHKAIGRNAARLIVGTAGAFAGGPIGQAALKAAPVAGNLIGQAAGLFAGDVAGQSATGGPVNLLESGVAAGTDLALGAGMHGAGYLLGRGGGVSKRAIQQGALRPDDILNPLQGDEYYDLAQNISADARMRLADPRFKTQPRQQLETMMAESPAEIDARAISDSLRAQKTGIARPEMQSVDSALEGHAARFEERAAQATTSPSASSAERYYGIGPNASPTYRVRPTEYDKFVREEMTAALKKYYEQHGGKLYMKALAKARKGAQDVLYETLGPESRQLGQEANKLLKVRERVANLLPTGTEVREMVGSPQQLRQALNPSNVGKGVAIRRALKAYDAANNTKWFETMEDLALREQWSPLDREAAGEIATFVLATGYRNRGWLERSATWVGKQALKQGVPGVGRRALAGEASSYLVPSHETTQ